MIGRRTRKIVAWLLLAVISVPALPAPASAAQAAEFERAYHRGDYLQAVDAIERVAAKKPKELNKISSAELAWLAHILDETGEDRAFAVLLGVLSEPTYLPDDLLEANEPMKLRYARLLAARGDSTGAQALVASLQSPMLIAEASLDPRFRSSFDEEPDVRAAGERVLAVHQDLMRSRPKRLRAVFLTARDQIRLGRPTDALNTLRAVELSVQRKGAFDDGDDMLASYWGLRAVALTMLGQDAQAVDSYRRAGARNAKGIRAGRQLINLAELQIAMGSQGDALETLTEYGGPRTNKSDEIRMRQVRGCAYALSGRSKDAAADLAFLRAQEAAAPDMLRRFLLCSGDLDGAAQSFIRHLGDREARAGALLDLSDFDPPLVQRAKDPLPSRLALVKDRADVQRAIRAAGGTRRFHMQRPEWFDR